MHCKHYRICTLVLILQFAAMLSFSQDNRRLSLGINPIVIANVGRSYGLNLQYEINKHIGVYIGGKYHQNFLQDPKMNSQRFRYRFYASSLVQHLGYNVGVNYKIKWPHSVLEPYVYYDVTYFNTDLRTLIFTDADTIIDGVNYDRSLVTPVKYYDLHSLENNIGLGFNCHLTKWLSINSRGGVGANFIFNLPANDYPTGKYTTLSLQYCIGFRIHF